MAIRELNDKQFTKLEQIVNADPEAKVIGWATKGKTGPIIRGTNGTEKIINITGRAVINDQRM